jgi:hypothetical protein
MPPIIGHHTGLQYIPESHLRQLLTPTDPRLFIDAIRGSAFSHEVKGWSDALLASLGEPSWASVTAALLTSAKIDAVPIPIDVKQFILDELDAR